MRVLFVRVRILREYLVRCESAQIYCLCYEVRTRRCRDFVQLNNIRPNSSRAIRWYFVRTSHAIRLCLILYFSVHWVSQDVFTPGRLEIPLVLGLFESKNNKTNQNHMLPKTNRLFNFDLNHVIQVPDDWIDILWIRTESIGLLWSMCYIYWYYYDHVN